VTRQNSVLYDSTFQGKLSNLHDKSLGKVQLSYFSAYFSFVLLMRLTNQPKKVQFFFYLPTMVLGFILLYFRVYFICFAKDTSYPLFFHKFDRCSLWFSVFLTKNGKNFVNMIFEFVMIKTPVHKMFDFSRVQKKKVTACPPFS